MPCLAGAGRGHRPPRSRPVWARELTCRCDSASTSTACSRISARPSATPRSASSRRDVDETSIRRICRRRARRRSPPTSPARLGYIAKTPNWWMEIDAYEPDQIARLYSLTRAAGWEVFFLTKRPPSAGDSVQFQTQWWIERFGFYLPSVLTVPGSRGDVANALRLDLLVDDQLINCVEVVSASPTKAILMQRHARGRAREHATSRGHRGGLDAGRRARRDRAAAGHAAAEARPPDAPHRMVPSDREAQTLPHNPRAVRPVPTFIARSRVAVALVPTPDQACGTRPAHEPHLAVHDRAAHGSGVNARSR